MLLRWRPTIHVHRAICGDGDAAAGVGWLKWPTHDRGGAVIARLLKLIGTSAATLALSLVAAAARKP